MKTKLFALALAASMAAGAAYAQTSTTTTTTEPTSQEGGSQAAAGNTDRGTPLAEETMAAFYTDSTMGTMRTDAELMTMWTGMTPEQQASMKSSCAEEFVSTQRDLPESYKAVCAKINTM